MLAKPDSNIQNLLPRPVIQKEKDVLIANIENLSEIRAYYGNANSHRTKLTLIWADPNESTPNLKKNSMVSKLEFYVLRERSYEFLRILRILQPLVTIKEFVDME